jgi:DNA-binding FadR family transcriptional regulator
MRLDAFNPFQAVQRTQASREIEVQIRDLIAEGQAKAGDRLPAERLMAQALGVGRSTLRGAIRIMEASGLLDARSGEGTFLAAPAALQEPDSDSAAAGNTLEAARISEVNRRITIQ